MESLVTRSPQKASSKPTGPHFSTSAPNVLTSPMNIQCSSPPPTPLTCASFAHRPQGECHRRPHPFSTTRHPCSRALASHNPRRQRSSCLRYQSPYVHLRRIHRPWPCGRNPGFFGHPKVGQRFVQLCQNMEYTFYRIPFISQLHILVFIPFSVTSILLPESNTGKLSPSSESAR